MKEMETSIMKLVLDEKKIRKGKPVGLPYVGSKKKVSKKIAQIIAQNFGTDKPFYDLFGGGGAVSLEMKLNGFEDVHYNELDSMTFEAFKTVLYEDFDVRDLIINRDDFLKIISGEHNGFNELKLLINSFGNNRKGYLYSKETADEKVELALKIVSEEKGWRSYKQTKTYKEHNENKLKRLQQIEQIKQIDQIQRIEQIERIKQIEQIERIQQIDVCVELTNKDYKYFNNISGAILYLDPPYEGATNGYSNKYVHNFDKTTYKEMRDWLIKHPDVETIVKNDFEFKLGKNSNNKNRMYVKHFVEEFDSAAFYDWAYKMSKNNIVIVSSYEVSDERFESVFEFKNASSTLAGGTDKSKTEKLFMVKAGL